MLTSLALTKHVLTTGLMAAAALLIPAALGLAHSHASKAPARKAILLVTFGTSIPEARSVFGIIEKAVREAHPGIMVRWAYTSSTIRRKLKSMGHNLDSPAEALARLMEEGYNQVAVQSLHVIPGAEYHGLVKIVRSFQNIKPGFNPVLGNPLCSNTDDLTEVTEALLSDLPQSRRIGDAVVYMGHGTHHAAGVVYPALGYMLERKDPLAFMGTVEGYPELKDIVMLLKAKGVEKAYLVPFMTVAGDHALNDMAGDEADSWKTVISEAGIKAMPVLKSISENPKIVAIWLKHLDAAMKHFK